MKLSNFDYNLPKELIAQYPLKERGSSRMMVLDRDKGTIEHKYFKDLISYLKKDDTIVFNDSRVIPARIPCKRTTGGKAEIFILKRVDKNLYEALVRPSAKLQVGSRLLSGDGRDLAIVAGDSSPGKLIKFDDTVDIDNCLDKIGRIPLPPYIKRDPDDSDDTRYQTIYAREDGSSASPTAGLHFTEDTLKFLERQGIGSFYVTLHVSYGTFAPVKVEKIEDHKIHSEFFRLRGSDKTELKRRKALGRVMAVGTTTTRVLETNRDVILNGNGKDDIEGWTDIFIYPPYKFGMVDMLLTNFHLPKSTLLMLVSAFAGREFILKAYEEAVVHKYRFYSYGDCMLIL